MYSTQGIPAFERRFMVKSAAEAAGLPVGVLRNWLNKELRNELRLPDAQEGAWRRFSLHEIITLALMKELTDIGITVVDAWEVSQFVERRLEHMAREKHDSSAHADSLALGAYFNSKGRYGEVLWVGKGPDGRKVYELGPTSEKDFREPGFDTERLVDISDSHHSKIIIEKIVKQVAARLEINRELQA